MTNKTMVHNSLANVYGTIVTVIFTFISTVTLQKWAAICAIFAGLSTGLYNIWRWNRERKKPKS